MVNLKFWQQNGSYRENRKHERADLFQASYFLASNGEHEKDAKECWLNNISVGGLSVDLKIEHQVSVNTIIVVLYKLGTTIRRDPLEIVFIRRLFNNWRCGCKFCEPDMERKEMILEYIKNEHLKED